MKAEPLDPVQLAGWWATLRDPVLSSLVERGIACNLDLKKAKSRVREARARRSVGRAALFPKIDASGSYTKSSGSKDIGNSEADLYSLGFDAGWELDLFGGTRRSIEAAKADWQAAREDLRDILVSLSAEVGLNYVEVRTYQARLAVARQNLKAQEEVLLLARSRSRAGLDTELAVQQARYNVESTRSEIPALCTGLEESMNRLAVLLGTHPGALHSELQRPAPIPVPPPEVAVGIPADILRQRPDVRRAERELAAQTARVGVATAELYPKLTLNGIIGLDALTLSNLLVPGSRSYSFGPSLSFPVFSAGAVRGNIEVQSALQEQALIAYQSSILTALEEVENALAAYVAEQNSRGSLREAADAARQAAILAESRYSAGQTDFSNVLDAQRSLLAFQDKLAESTGTVAANLVRLYKALGGGWTSLSPASAQEANDSEDEARAAE